MEKKIGDIEIQKQKKHHHKRPISSKNKDINKIVVCNKISLGKKGFKYFVGYNNARKIRPLCMYLPKMSACRRDFDETKCTSFLIKDDKLLEKYNEVWEKVKNSIKKKFDSKPVYNEKYLEAKIKSYNGKINTDFLNDKIPKEDSQFILLSVISIDSVFRTSKNYYPQVFLEEFKYVFREKKIPKYITDDIELSSDFDREHSVEENFDEENSNEEKSDEENSDEENFL